MLRFKFNEIHFLLKCSVQRSGGFSPAFRPMGAKSEEKKAMKVQEPKQKEETPVIKPVAPSPQKEAKVTPSSTPPKNTKQGPPLDMFSDMFAFDNTKAVPSGSISKVTDQVAMTTNSPQAPTTEMGKEKEVKKEDAVSSKGSTKGKETAQLMKPKAFLPRTAIKGKPVTKTRPSPSNSSTQPQLGVAEGVSVEEPQTEMWKVASMLHQSHTKDMRSEVYLQRCKEKIERCKHSLKFVRGGVIVMEELKGDHENIQPYLRVKAATVGSSEETLPSQDTPSFLATPPVGVAGFKMAEVSKNENKSNFSIKPKRSKFMTVSDMFNQESDGEGDDDGPQLSARGVAWSRNKPSSLPQ